MEVVKFVGISLRGGDFVRKDFRFTLQETADNIKVQPISLDSELWGKYRAASHNLLGCLIDALEGGECDIYDVCENISHQMSFYPALYLAMPHLVEYLYENNILFDPQVAICLATDFANNRQMSWKEGQDARDEFEPEVVEAYEQSIQKLRLMTLQYLNEHIEEIRAYDPIERSYFATAVLAVLGDREAAFALVLNNWDMCIMACDACDYFDEDIVLSDDSREAIEPAESVIGQWDGESFEDTYLWLSNCLSWMGASEELEILSYYYGTYECPQCGKKMTVMDFVKNAYFCE